MLWHALTRWGLVQASPGTPRKAGGLRAWASTFADNFKVPPFLLPGMYSVMSSEHAALKICCCDQARDSDIEL